VALSGGSVYSVDAGDQSTTSSWSSGDPISVGQGGDTLANTSTGDNATVTRIGNTADGMTYTGSGDHTQQTKSDDGSLVVLNDGSVWEVFNADQSTATSWSDSAAITVTAGSASAGTGSTTPTTRHLCAPDTSGMSSPSAAGWRRVAASLSSGAVLPQQRSHTREAPGMPGGLVERQRTASRLSSAGTVLDCRSTARR